MKKTNMMVMAMILGSAVMSGVASANDIKYAFPQSDQPVADSTVNSGPAGAQKYGIGQVNADGQWVGGGNSGGHSSHSSK